MRLPLEIVVRDFPITAAIRAEIEERAGRLDHFYERIMRCRVTVDGAARHHRHGRCRVLLHLTVPGRQIVVTHQAGGNALEAIKEAFDAAGRRIEDHVRRARGFVKAHEEALAAPREEAV
jgi:ribosome-associated translation inhibitor RaiA